MGQSLHGSATTPEAVRRAIQHSEESLRALAKRYGINQKAVAKWKGQPRSPIGQPVPRRRNRRFFPSRTRRSSSHSADIRCCHLTIAFTPCKRRSRI